MLYRAVPFTNGQHVLHGVTGGGHEDQVVRVHGGTDVGAGEVAPDSEHPKLLQAWPNRPNLKQQYYVI